MVFAKPAFIFYKMKFKGFKDRGQRGIRHFEPHNTNMQNEA